MHLGSRAMERHEPSHIKRGLLAACDLMLQGNSERGLCLTSAQHVTRRRNEGKKEQGERNRFGVACSFNSKSGPCWKIRGKRPPPSPPTGPINEREPNRAISIWPGRLFLAVTAVFVRSGESSLPPSLPLPEIRGGSAPRVVRNT